MADPLTGRTLTYSRNSLGQLASVSYGAGASRTFTYNPFGELASDTSKTTANATSAAVSYAYDNDGLLAGKTTAGFAGAAANTYAYDGSARLTSWVAGSTTIGYGWDDADNRTSVSRTVGGQTSTITASFNERNMLLSFSDGTSHTYTPRGTRASSTGATNTTYQTDAFDRLVSSVTTGGGAGTETTNVAYDGLNRAASVNSSPVSYSDPGNTPSALPASGGSTLITRDPAGDPVSDRTTGGANRVLLGDRHTDVTGAVDPATGNLAASTNLDPFGGATSTTGTPSALGFQSGWSADGLLNTASRWYDPDAGAFTSRDTWTLNPATDQTNRYNYSTDPLDEVDPTGHKTRPEIGGTGGGGGGGGAGPRYSKAAMERAELEFRIRRAIEKFSWENKFSQQDIWDWGSGSGYSSDGNPYAPRGGSRYPNSYDNSPGGGGGYSGGSGGHSRPRPLTQAEKNAIQHSRNLHTPIPRSSPKASGNSRPSLVISKKPIVNETGSISNNRSKTTQCDVTCSTQTNPNSTPSSSNPSAQLAEPRPSAGDGRGPVDPPTSPPRPGSSSSPDDDDGEEVPNAGLGELVQDKNRDPAADKLARRLGGMPRAKFSNDPSQREFDVVSDDYIAQTKGSRSQKIGSEWRDQTKKTFEYSKRTGRQPYFHFEHEPTPNVLRKINEYAERYGIDAVIDIGPLGE